jgi:hypothetical protein
MIADTIPISEFAQRTLVELAAKTGQRPGTILDAAVEDYRRKLFFEAMNAGYAALRADQEAWNEEQAERKVWDSTNADGLPQEPTL